MKNQPSAAIILFVICAHLFHAHAFVQPHQEPLPNFDKRAPDEAGALAPAAEDAAAQLQQAVPGVSVKPDRVLGTPRWIHVRGGFLTGPSLTAGVRGPTQAVVGFPIVDPHAPIRTFMNQYPGLFGGGDELVDGAEILRDYVTPHNELRTVVWQQNFGGISVHEALFVGHITRNGEIVNLSSRFVPDLEAAVAAGQPAGFAPSAAAASLKGPEAVIAAAEDLGATGLSEAQLTLISGPDSAALVQAFTSPQLSGEAHAKLVWLPLSRNEARLAWRVEVAIPGRAELYSLVVDAHTGEVLMRRCLTSYISDATYNVFTSDSPSPFSPGHPTPSTDQPPLVERQLVTLSALNTNASPNGWINDGDTTTSGNNVAAHTDLNADNFPDLPRPDGGTNRVFDFPLDLTLAPVSYQEAAVVQLFYWNNWMHDRLYDLGFVEAAGNFQNNNFDRGGLGNDAVIADAQDGAGFNNANFATPPDGAPGRMQMFIFDFPNPARDGDLDAEVILHEYTHGLSNRLVGGGPGISELQPAGMGEGWSDFYALALLSEPSDDVHGNYAAGGYLTYQLAGLTENYYFGIRRYPYSTDMSKNPLTFKDIDPSQASLHIGVPISPVSGGGPADQVHNMGEVWCVTLWDARANIIDRVGYDLGNEQILLLVTEGMRLSPVNPTYIEARDAILQADLVLTGGDNRADLWVAFAKRGMGASASAPPSDTTLGVVEAFDLPPDVVPSLPDGILEVVVTPGNRAALFASSTENIFLRVTDGISVTNATVEATVTGGQDVLFRNDGMAPDVTADNSIYSGELMVPADATELILTLVITAPEKDPSTNVINYSVVPPPANDDMADAIKLPLAGASYLNNNRFATLEDGEPTHAGQPSSGASLWWVWSSSTATNLLVDTAGSLFDTVIGVYRGSSVDALTTVAFADNFGSRRQAFLNFDAEAGVAYRIAVASANANATGTLRLRIAPEGVPDTNAPVVTVTAPSSGFISTTNRVTVTGTAVDPKPNVSGIDSINVRVNPASTSPTGGDGSPVGGGPTGSLIESTNWSRTVALSEGLNVLTVNATDVAGNSSPFVSLQVNYRPVDPVNDVFANAIVLTEPSGTNSINNGRATRESGEPLHANNSGGKSAWWTWRAPSDGTLFLSTESSTFDTLLGLYTGSRVNDLTFVAANDDALEDVSFSKLTQAVRSNVTYRIAVDGFDGSSGVVVLEHEFTPAQIFQVALDTTTGGVVTPPGGDFMEGTLLLIEATAQALHNFQRWEGSFTSSSNPLSLVVNSNINLTAVFALQEFADDFESGDFDPSLNYGFTNAGSATPWTVQGDTVALGSFAARSGQITHGQRSVLTLTASTPAGSGSFDVRVSSEANWDFLEFRVNGLFIRRWSGDVDWETFEFALPEAVNTLEWRYVKDVDTSEGLDAAFIDNLVLPTAAAVPPQLSFLGFDAGAARVRLNGTPGQTYVIQSSQDLVEWTHVSTNTASDGTITFMDSGATGVSPMFYRAFQQP